MLNLAKNVVIAFVLVLASCKPTQTLKIQLDDVSGLTKNSPVLMEGVKVGTVENISVLENSKLLVKTKLTGKPQITSDAKFVLSSTNLLGSKVIIIRNGTSTSPMNLKEIQQGQIE